MDGSTLLYELNLKLFMQISLTARSEVKALVAWTLRSWIRLLLKAWVVGPRIYVLCCSM
jgi:hypothetical protein